MNSQYQLLAPLRPEEYRALKADIAKRGVLVAVELDDAGIVLDGHNRVAIAAELGIEYPTIVRRFDSEEAKREHILKINLLRRHLGPIAWADAFKMLAEVRGVRLGAGRPNTEDNRLTIGRLAAELGVKRATAYNRLQLAADLADAPDLAENVDSGEMAVSTARKAMRRRQQAPSVDIEPTIATDRCRLYNCDFRDAPLEDDSIDAIVTDPPYPREYIPLYGDLAQLAARVLKPGGLLVVMVGQSYLPEILGLITPHLSYTWICAYLTPGASTKIWQQRMNSNWKPLLIFAKGESSLTWPSDVLKSDRPDKDRHDWGQSESGMAQIVERFTKPGDLVLDPFMGAGTTGVMALEAGRRFVGIDNDAAAYGIAARRLGVD